MKWWSFFLFFFCNLSAIAWDFSEKPENIPYKKIYTQYLVQANYKQALAELNLQKQLINHPQAPQWPYHFYLSAEILYDLGVHHLAQAACFKGIEASRNFAAYSEVEAYLWLKLAEIEYLFFNSKQSCDYCDSAATAFIHSNTLTPMRKALVLNCRAKHYGAILLGDSSVTNSHNAMQIVRSLPVADRTPETYKVIYGYHQISRNHSWWGRIDDINDFIDIRQGLIDSLWIAYDAFWSRNSIRSVQLYLGVGNSYLDVIQYTSKAIPITEDYYDSAWQVIQHHKLPAESSWSLMTRSLQGLTYVYTHEYQKAFPYFESILFLKPGKQYTITQVANYRMAIVALRWYCLALSGVLNSTHTEADIQKLIYFAKIGEHWKYYYHLTKMLYQYPHFRELYNYDPSHELIKAYEAQYRIKPTRQALEQGYYHIEQRKNIQLRARWQAMQTTNTVNPLHIQMQLQPILHPLKKMAVHEDVRVFKKYLFQKPIDSTALLSNWTQKMSQYYAFISNPAITPILRPQVPAISELQKRLQPQQAIAMFVEANFEPVRISAIVITPDTAMWVYVTHTDRWPEYDLHRFGKHTKRFSDFYYYRQILFETYCNTFEPIQRHLPGHVNEVLLIPSSSINIWPFDAGISDTTSGNLPTQWNYLLNRYTFSYAPSLDFFIQASRQNYNLHSGIEVGTFEPQSSALSSLYFSKKYADSLQMQFKTQLFSGDKLMQNVLQTPNYQASILHLNLHGDESNYSSASAGLFYTAKDSIVRIDILDIKNSSIKSNLVVVNACNSGKKYTEHQEADLGFNYAFHFAGVPAVLTTLNESDDQVNAQIIYNFYKNLDKGYSKPHALRLAKLDYLRQVRYPEWAAPHIWAGLQISGNPFPLQIPHPPFFSYKMLLSFCLMLMGWGLWLLFKK